MRVRGPIRKVISVGNGRSESRPRLGATMQQVISVCSPGPRDTGGEWRCGTERVGGVKNASYYLPWWSIVPIRVGSRVAVRSERRHDALALSSAAHGFVTVARATRFDGAIAGGRVELDSTVARAAFVGLLDVV